MKIIITGGSGFIGTNLIETLLQAGHDIVNADTAEPCKKQHISLWRRVDIMDEVSMSAIFTAFQPEVVIHLAARTDCSSNNVADYAVNDIGTRHVLNAVRECPSVQRFVFASTQYVYKNPILPFPEDSEDYHPHTAYGISKANAEKAVREAGLRCAWTIVRPTNVWGPWHMRYPNELWKFIARGQYVHPSRKPVIRTYAYVGTVVHQIIGIINTPEPEVNGKTFYLGDLPVDSYVWLNELSLGFTGRKLLRVPRFIFWGPVLFGECLRRIGMRFPIHITRYRNMVEDYYAPTNLTIELFGASPLSLSEKVMEVKKWLTGEGHEYFDYWRNR